MTIKLELTHVKLANKAGHVVMLEVLWQNILCKLALVIHDEACTILRRKEKKSHLIKRIDINIIGISATGRI